MKKYLILFLVVVIILCSVNNNNIERYIDNNNIKNVAVTIVGVTRPNSERIKKNIQNNIKYFKDNYPNLNFQYYLVTYKNKYTDDLKKFLDTIEIKYNIIGQITDEYINNDLNISLKKNDDSNTYSPIQNTYRMFYSINKCLNMINYTPDIVIRLRIDHEIQNFEIKKNLNNNIYYGCKARGGVNDNIGYSSFENMKKIWIKPNLQLINYGLQKKMNNEKIIRKMIEKNNIKVLDFFFKEIHYQGNDDYIDGIKQSSKRNVVFECNKKVYYL